MSRKRKPSGPRAYYHFVVGEILRGICVEFEVSEREIFEGGRGSENMLRLMAICLAEEVLREKSVKTAAWARAGLHKYLKFIPGLRKKYKKLKAQLQKKLVDFDV